MPQGIKFDVDAFHARLYEMASPQHTLKINLKELAPKIPLSYCHASVVINKMVKDGRLKYMGGMRNVFKMYLVRDPADF